MKRRVLRLLAAAVLALTTLSVGLATSGTQASGSASDGVTGHMWDDGLIR
jgi:Spy/CpxP family protein refolding chaperone